MFDYRCFNDVFDFDADYKYGGPSIDAIESHRKKLEGLFIDRVLKLLEIKRPAKYYPPKTNEDLKNVHEAISSAASADHTKLSALYYLLLDCDDAGGQQRCADSFEEKSRLPKRYQIFMKGLWHMDHLQFEIALQYLTHPSLIPTFHEEILETLVNHAKHDPALSLAYYHTVQPSVFGSRALEKLFKSIAQVSVTEAFYFARGQVPTSSQRHMFEVLISSVLHGSTGENAAARGVELVNLPFNQEEEHWFEEYLTSGEGRGFRKAKDTLIMRTIGVNRFSEALSMQDAGARSAGGMNWTTLQNACLGDISRVDRRSAQWNNVLCESSEWLGVGIERFPENKCATEAEYLQEEPPT